MSAHYSDATVTLHHGDCLDVLATLPDASVDAVVCDPPYGLANTDPAHVAETITRWVNGERDYLPGGSGFMGKAWDAFVPPVAVWDECLRVLKPGGHVLAFAGSRTVDLMTLGLRLAGFDIRDSVAWLYGSGFPKSMDVSKAIDKAARGVPQGAADPTSPNHGQYRTTTTEGKRWDSDKGQGYGAGGSRFLTSTASERTTASTTPTTSGTDAAAADGSPSPTLDATATDWEGWGTALKPAFEPIVMGRKPLAGTVAANVLAHGTGALNIDGCRIEGVVPPVPQPKDTRREDGDWSGFLGSGSPGRSGEMSVPHPSGRWPANVVLDESQAAELDQQAPETGGAGKASGPSLTGTSTSVARGTFNGVDDTPFYGDTGGASRFFFIAREDNEPCHSTSAASTVESPSSRPSEPADSAPSGAATTACPDGARPTDSPSTSATPNGSRPSGESGTPATTNTASESSHDWQPAKPSQMVSPARYAASLAQTDTTTTTTSPSTSDGSADLTTSSTTPTSAPGVPLDDLSSRFMYVAKAGADERVRVNGTAHPTVKPLALMRWLVRLVTPPGGTVLEPFAGSGTTVEACILEGFRCIAIEREADYLPLIVQRINRRRDPVEAVRGAGEDGGLFDLLDGGVA